MRSNQHIGFLHYKWGIISLVSMLIYIPAINLVLDLLSHLHRFNFENAGNFNNYSFRQAMKIQWMGLKPFFYVGLSYVIIVNIFKLLASLIDERIRKVEELAILPLFLSLLYSGYLCFVNATNLSENNVKNIGSEDGAFLYGLLVFLTAVLVLFIKIGGCLKFCEFISGLYEIPITIKGSGFYRRRYSQGFGGTADWANFKTFRKKEVKFNSQPPSTEGFLTSDIILGKSLFDDDPNPRLVGIKDDAHCITVAMTGSGKTTTVLNTNLAVYDASIYVFDPKGEFAKNTFERRCNDPCIYSPLKYRMNGNAFLLDPFNETLDSLPHSFYNPLTEIDLTSDKMMDVISAISDGCVVSSSNEKDPHWNEWAKNLIEALIIHVISAYPKDKHNLPFVLDLFTGMETYITEDINEKKLSRFDELLIDMIMNESAGGIVKQTATLISSMGSEEKGAVLSTTYRNMKWVGDPAMRKQLSNSSPFLISNLKNQKITVYMVLDSNMIKSQMRWVRILSGVFLIQEKKRRQLFPSLTPSLFILDEFHQLGGKIDTINKGFALLRGYGCKLWLVFQSLAQLKSNFGNDWSDVVSAATIQTFGVNDPITAEWISTRLGSRVNTETFKGGQSNNYKEKEANLLTPEQVYKELGKDSNKQIIFTPDSKPMRLERMTYKSIKLKGNIKKISINLKGHFLDW